MLVQLSYCNGKYSGFIQENITIHAGFVECEDLVNIMIPLINNHVHSFIYFAHIV